MAIYFNYKGDLMILIEDEGLFKEEFEAFMAQLLFMIQHFVYENKENKYSDTLLCLLQNVNDTLACIEMILHSKEKNISHAEINERLRTLLKIN